MEPPLHRFPWPLLPTLPLRDNHPPSVVIGFLQGNCKNKRVQESCLSSFPGLFHNVFHALLAFGASRGIPPIYSLCFVGYQGSLCPILPTSRAALFSRLPQRIQKIKIKPLCQALRLVHIQPVRVMAKRPEYGPVFHQ